MKTSLKISALLLAATTVLCACMTPLTANNYNPAEARTVQEVSFGKVIGMRQVAIDGINTGQGIATGGLAGAIAGSTYGTGNVNVLATAGGGLLGSVLGQGAEELVTRKNGVELIIALDGGRIVVVVQEQSKNTVFEMGQRVRLMVSGSATRVIPDSTTSL